MAKLYFRYGAVSSAKTLNLLAVAHNYRLQSKPVILIKPALDDRFGAATIKSRAGLEVVADIAVKADESRDLWMLIEDLGVSEIFCILVDEVQFLSLGQIEQLREIASTRNIPVICYGLRTDFKSFAFPASRRLFELADTLEEVKTTCFACNRKALMNLKHVGGRASRSGASIDLGCEEKYLPACFGCYRERLNKAEGRELNDSLFQSEESDKLIGFP